MRQNPTSNEQVKIIRRHYGLRRDPTAAEVNAEIANLERKGKAGTLDDKQEKLCAALNISWEIDVPHYPIDDKHGAERAIHAGWKR